MRHVIVGRGPAGVVAAETLRAHDRASEVLLIGDEPGPAYSRMAIPYLLARQIREEGTWLRHDTTHFERQRVGQLETRVEALNAESKTLALANGTTLDYDRLLLATGSSPVDPPIEGVDLPRVHHCWTLEDAHHIMESAEAGSRVVLMGAGFIGCIIMEALKLRGVRLTVVEAGDRMVPRMMDQVAGNLIKQWCIDQGIEVCTSTRITRIEPGDEGLWLHCEPGEPMQADLVVVATGVRPNVGFLQESGVEIGNGIRVDAHQRSSVDDVYAAGDVCEGASWQGGRGVHAIQPMAVETARVAALNMVGREATHVGSLDMNVLDTLGLISVSYGQWMGVEGGDSASLLDERSGRYVKLRFDGDHLIGGITLGITEHVGALRGLIQSRRHLGVWKKHLMENPTRFMEAWVSTVP